MRTVWAIGSLIAGVVVAAQFGPEVAEQLNWPTWLAYIVIFLDIVLVLGIPYNWQEYTAQIRLYNSGSLGRAIVDFHPGCSFLLIIATVVVPIIGLVWLANIVFK